MVSQLLLAIGLPLVLLVGATFLTMKLKDGLPAFLQRISSKEAMLWNIMIGFSIAVSLAYMMTRK
jgi:hypothetical protein